MAKIDWPRMGGTFRPSVRGVFTSYLDKRTGYIAKAWPRKRGRKTLKPSVVWNNLQYGVAQQMSVQPNYLDYGMTQNWSAQVPLTWRDIFSLLIRGQFLELTNLDGTSWQRQLCMSDNPQYLLDLLGADVGSLLVRGSDGWQTRLPGTDGYILQLVGGQPVWVPQGQGSLQTWIDPAQIGVGQAGSVSAGNIVGNLVRSWGNFTANKVVFYAGAAAATAHVTPCIYSVPTLSPTSLIVAGPTVTGVALGKNSLPLTSPLNMSANTFYCACVLCRIAAVSICGRASSAVYTFAYNTNDTPPASISGAIASAQIYSGVGLET